LELIMASAGVGITTQVSTPSTQGNGEGPTGGNTAPVGSVESPGAQREGPSIQEASAALAAASEGDEGANSTQENPTPENVVNAGRKSVQKTLFMKIVDKISEIFRFLTPGGLAEWLAGMMKRQRQEATPA